MGLFNTSKDILLSLEGEYSSVLLPRWWSILYKIAHKGYSNKLRFFNEEDNMDERNNKPRKLVRFFIFFNVLRSANVKISIED